jgi:hypothetical protein
MKTYSYKECLENAYRVNWTIDGLLDGRSFDRDRRWLPAELSAADAVTCLNEEEKRRFTHVEMGAYAHLFGYVEEFIAPTMTHLSRDYELDNREGFDALANFVAEEVKHMNMFRRVRTMVDETLGFELKLLDGVEDVARFVMSKNLGAVLLLIDAIEWFTQRHYVSAFKTDEDIDPLTRHIFRAHWLEESQHARIDHMEALRAFDGMDASERDVAVSDLIELVTAVDGLLVQQTEYDIRNLERYLGRIFDTAEKDEIRRAELEAKRWVFIYSGVTHAKFEELFLYVTTPDQQQRVQEALAA